MKKALLLIAIIVFALSACKQDFDITASYKEVPLVYGLLNQQDSANIHFVRIQKAFLLQGSAYTAAGNPDSIYYTDSLLVQIKTEPTGAIYTLTKVNGDL